MRYLIWLALYLVWMGAIWIGLVGLRQQAVARLDTPQARAEWQRWREEAARQAAGEGPVRRRVPESSEPPSLVLLRDHFATCLAGGWLFGSILFVVVVLMVRGVLRSPPGFQLEDPAGPSGRRGTD